MSDIITQILNTTTILLIALWLLKLDLKTAKLEHQKESAELAALRARVEAILGTPLEIRERHERNGDQS